VEGAPNVLLETVKCGDYDTFENPVNLDNKDSTATVVLRLYEAFGIHAQVKIVISPHLPVIKGFTTNLMEDEDEELNILRDSDTTESGCTLSLSFRGFETVKLIVGGIPINPRKEGQSIISSTWLMFPFDLPLVFADLAVNSPAG